MRRTTVRSLVALREPRLAGHWCLGTYNDFVNRASIIWKMMQMIAVFAAFD